MTKSAGPRGSAPRRLGFLITPRWIGLEIAVIAFTLACYFLLAPWQFTRSDEHDAQMAEVAAAVAAPVADVSELLSTTAPPGDGVRWRMASATGHFDSDHQAYIRLRQDNDGKPAYEVVAPFVTASGVVLVDRGYVPFQLVQESTLRLPPLPTGTVTVTGRAQPDQTDPRDRPPAAAPDGRMTYTAASSEILRATGSAEGPVYVGFLQLAPDSPGVIDAVALPEGDNSRPFFSYAIQWLSFGGIAVLGFGYFVYREFRDPVAGEIYVTGPPSPELGGPGGDGPDPTADSSGPTDSPAGRSTAAAPPAEVRRGRSKFDKSQLFDA